mgnify:CR=1 FL=1
MNTADLPNKPLWRDELKKAADPGRARSRLLLLAETSAAPFLESADRDQARILCALFSGSRALGNLLCSKPGWIRTLTPAALAHPRRKPGLSQEVNRWLMPALKAADFTAVLRQIREFKEQETLRIATRDLAGLAGVEEITQELSDLADICLSTVWATCMRQLNARYGAPYHQGPDGKWLPTGACVLGLGKLGGGELNYSSDVDLMFVYSEEGSVFAKTPTGQAASVRVLSNHQFFNKLAETFSSEVARLTPDGTLYRVDLRLRPEGDSGPLSRSVSSCENYYAQWGQTWERMMLIKARCVAGDNSVAGEFLEMIQPFRYPRSINTAVLREVASMKDRIETEVVKSGELDRNVKLGRGGIREVEFIAQSLQLLHAGRQPFLQSSRTLECLDKLVAYEHLAPGDARQLSEAYCFLRTVEHRLQMEENQQTHTIPADAESLLRIAKLMGFKSKAGFDDSRKKHASTVRTVFERLLRADATQDAGESPLPARFEGEEARWKQCLARYKFRDPEKAFKVLREFVEGPGYVHVSSRTIGLAHQLLPRLFALCPNSEHPAHAPKRSATAPVAPSRNAQPPLSDPDRVITRLDSFIAAYGARSTLFELWHANPSIFELLILLFDRSEFLAELAIRTPDLVDELVTSDRLRQRKTSAETLEDLRHGLHDADQHFWLRRYHQAELMRIGLRDILGLADPEQYLVELSALADACLAYALDVVTRKYKLKEAPFAIIGLGKLGGEEIDYGSDLDIIFVASPQTRDIIKPSRAAVDLMDLLSARTEQGIVFQTDARLRPDGQKGLLVNKLTSYEDYYRNRALLWEIQALSRARTIAGNAAAMQSFNQLAGNLCNFKSPSLPLAAYSRDWKDKIHQMRVRIEKERTPVGKDHLAIKTGAGGLVDAEFIAQALCLEHGWHEPNTLAALERARDAGVLHQPHVLIRNYRFLRRVEGILRRWSYEGESVLPDDPAPFYRVSIRCGFAGPEDFSKKLADCRSSIRNEYLRYFEK